MKFFTAILSALALALAFAISTTSAIPIDPRMHASFPLSIMERQDQQEKVHHSGFPVNITWNGTFFVLNSSQKKGDISLLNAAGVINPSKLFSLPPLPRAPVASNSFFHPWLNCVQPPHVAILATQVTLSQGIELITLPPDLPARDDYFFFSKSPSCGLGSIP